MNNQITETDIEKRCLPRNPAQVMVKLYTLDDQEHEGAVAIIKDITDQGLSLLTDIPLPLGTIIKIKKDEFTATGEVAGWEWDTALSTARLGVRLLEKKNDWLII